METSPSQCRKGGWLSLNSWRSKEAKIWEAAFWPLNDYSKDDTVLYTLRVRCPVTVEWFCIHSSANSHATATVATKIPI
jgi:hypothetical protein